MRRGEVWWYEPPHEKPRPALILTCDDLIADIFDVIAVPATTNIRDTPTEVQIGVADGMPAECVLALANTFSARRSTPPSASQPSAPSECTKCAAL